MTSPAHPEIWPAEIILDRLCAPMREELDCRRVMVIFAHPDDEAIALGGQMGRMDGLKLLLVTDGAPQDMRDALARGFSRREDYADARRLELLNALAVVGKGPDALTTFDVPDQTAMYRMAELASRLCDLLRAQAIATVFTHTYEGGHPDHDATACIVHAASYLLERDGAERPAIIEFPLYHSRKGQWVFQEFAPGDRGGQVWTAVLDDIGAQEKRRMIAAHLTQRRLLSSFAIDVERFRPASKRNFAQLPNRGDILYEQLRWGIGGADWVTAVETTRRELDLPGWF